MRAITPKLAGVTLIELMVALAIGSLLVVGAIDVFAQARSAYRTAEGVARLQETLRFAMNILVEDIRLAHYWGRTNQTGRIEREPDARVTCGGRDVTGWALDVARGIEARDTNYDLPCPGAEPRVGSDVIVVRHAQPEATVPDRRKIQIQSNGGGGRLFSSGNRPAPFRIGGAIFDVVVNAYYVGNRSNYEAGMPALRRRSLVGRIMQDQEIISGIDTLHVQLGIDRDGDGLVDAYVDGGTAARPDPEQHILAVRVRIEARTEAGYPQRRAALTRTIVIRNAG